MFLKSLKMKFALLALASTACTYNAHAVVAIFYGGDFYALENLFLCGLVLPLCILDQKVDAVPSLGRQDLVDQGLSADKAVEYVKMATALSVRLSESGRKLQVGSQDTADKLEAEILSILPNGSEQFAKFYAKQILAI